MYQICEYAVDMGRADGTIGILVYVQRVETRCYEIYRADGSLFY